MKTRLLLAAIFVAATLGVSACGKHKYTKEDLNPALANHFINIRWGRVVRASESVEPGLRQAFVEHWTRQNRVADIQDIDVAAKIFNDEGDRADVTLNVTWVARVQQTVRVDTLSQVWNKTEKGWVATSLVELPFAEAGFGGS